jgi:hypothetical protein
MRWLLAWILYAIGDAIYVVFDQWLPWGMVGPIYRLYSASMVASTVVQGDGPGPWMDVAPQGLKPDEKCAVVVIDQEQASRVISRS